MARERRQGIIVEIYARHTGPGSKRAGTYNSRRHPYKPARMTLWAITAQEDHVWLETKKWLSTARINAKVDQYEQENAHRVGEEITYVLKDSYSGIGFIRN